MANRSLPRLVGGVVAALSVLLVITAPSQALTDVEEFMRFAYWTGCSPLRLIVAMEPEDAARIGLTKEAVATAVRSRLRAARLYTGTDNREVPVLFMHVGILHSQRRIGGAFSIDVALHKPVYDPLTGLSLHARTNEIDGIGYAKIGLHAGNPSFILSAIAQAMDGFLDAYLRVNEPACY